MERIVDQIQTTPDRWFLNLHTGHTIDGRRPCLAARWPWLSDAAVFQSAAVDEAGRALQFLNEYSLTAEEVLCALFGAKDREELGPTGYTGVPDETWMDSLKKSASGTPWIRDVNPLDGGCIFVTLTAGARITLDLHELDGYEAYSWLRNPLVSSQIRTDGGRLLFGGRHFITVGELFDRLLQKPQSPRTQLL